MMQQRLTCIEIYGMHLGWNNSTLLDGQQPHLHEKLTDLCSSHGEPLETPH